MVDGIIYQITVTISAGGKATTSVRTGATTYRGRGEILAGGRLVIRLPAGPARSASAILQLVGEPKTAQLLTGELRRSAEPSLPLQLYSPGEFEEPAPFAGIYTFALPPLTGEGQPPGWSWISANVRSTGSVKISGRLAGGKAFSGSVRLSHDGKIALAPIGLGSRNHLGLELTFAAAPKKVTGTARWMRPQTATGAFPAAVDETVAVTGEVFTLGPALASMEGGLDYSRAGGLPARLAPGRRNAKVAEFLNRTTKFRLLPDGRFTGHEMTAGKRSTFSGVWLN